MLNESILVSSLILMYGCVLLMYKFFGRTGLYVWTAIATIVANIEVIIFVEAFGMEQTLGNILFASTFLVTDILSENEGAKFAKRSVCLGIVSSIIFIAISRTWFLYIPSESDWATPAILEVFANTPRFMIVGVAVYAISQVFDVWIYDKIWAFTEKKFANVRKGLWLRNNISTLLSQFLNTILFTVGAFYGMEGYNMELIISIIISSYIIFIATSICDTPAIYLARIIKDKGVPKDDDEDDVVFDKNCIQ